MRTSRQIMRGCHAPSASRFQAVQWMTIADSAISIGWHSPHVTENLLERMLNVLRESLVASLAIRRDRDSFGKLGRRLLKDLKICIYENIDSLSLSFRYNITRLIRITKLCFIRFSTQSSFLHPQREPRHDESNTCKLSFDLCRSNLFIISKNA